MSKFMLVIALAVLVAPLGADATVVRMFTLMGEIDVELDYSAPVTCANFLRYVNTGAYDNSIFHRSIPGFVLQGGGFALDPPDSNFLLHDIPTYDPIVNEYSPDRSNLFGTIAMAKLAYDPNTGTGGPDSATSQWFFNLGDNSANLDNQNGGFTVFGNVVDGVDVLLALEAMDRWNFGAPFDNMPTVETYTGEAMPTHDELATIYAMMVLADADGDGVVGAADYIALKHNFGTDSGATWEQGDFDGDGDVDVDDKAILEFSYGQGPIVTAAPAQSASVPEPATLSLLAMGWVAMIRRRRQQSVEKCI